MPNRYGEHPQPDDDDEPNQPQPATHTTDHAAAAQRGINLIYATMGWKHPQNPPESTTDPKNRTP